MSNSNIDRDALEDILREFSSSKPKNDTAAPATPERKKTDVPPVRRMPEKAADTAKEAFSEKTAPVRETEAKPAAPSPAPKAAAPSPAPKAPAPKREMEQESFEQMNFDSLDNLNADIGLAPGPALPAIDPDNPEDSNFYEDKSFGNTEYYDEDDFEEENSRKFHLFKKREKTPEEIEEEEYGEDKPKKKWILPVCIVLVLLLAIGGAVYVAADTISSGDKIFPNVYIDGIEVGGMTADEARSMLESCNWEKSVSGDLEIRLPMDVTETVNYVEAGVRMTADEALGAAVAYGRGTGSFEQLKTYINCMIIPVDVAEKEIVINSDYVMSRVEEAAKKFEKATEDNAYKVDVDRAIFSMLKGAGEIKIDTQELYNKVDAALRTEEESVIYRLGDVQLETPDFKKILEKERKEPADAYYDSKKDEIVPEVVGVEFDPAEAAKIWKEAEPLSYVEVPMFTTPAEVTAEQLKSTLFVDVLGEYTTNYKGSTDNRVSNIKLAVQKINGMVLNPGETFSYNKTLGERTAEKGYLEAAAYDNGDVIQALGGGICQVSTTLCCAVRLSLLDYTRTCHQFQVAYIEAGRDATVDYTNFENGGGVDFTFTNNKEYPIKIVCSVNEDDTTITFQILGTDTDHYTTSFQEKFVGYLSHSDAYGHDDTHSDNWNSTRVGYMYDAFVEVYDADGNFVKEIYTYDYDRCWYFYHKENINYPAEEPITPGQGEEEASSEAEG